MPYIPEGDKAQLDLAEYLIDPVTVGELTYVLTKRCIDYYEKHGESFQTHAQVIAALECTKLEFYRRALAPYEDKKVLENGDVYT